MKKILVVGKGRRRLGKMKNVFFIFFSAGVSIRGQNFIFFGPFLEEKWWLCWGERKWLW